ncbi:MAG: hypothetical protein Q9157_004098 [Trypethelium eluteriae]
MDVSKKTPSRTSLDSTEPLLTLPQAHPQSAAATIATSPPTHTTRHPPPFHEFYTPRARDFGSDTASVAPSTASTVLPAYSTVARYGRFKSEDVYLAALREFAEEKKYMEPTRDLKGREVSVLGFYGDKSMNEIAGPRQERKENRAQCDNEQGRRKSSLTGLGLRERIRGRKGSGAV